MSTKIQDAVDEIQRRTVMHIVSVLERGAPILDGMSMPWLSEAEAARLRALRDQLVDYDRLHLLYEPHKQPPARIKVWPTLPPK